MHTRRLVDILFINICFFSTLGPVEGRSLNGFDLRDALIPLDEIHHSGLNRDGIPAIMGPKFVPAEDADWLLPDARILGIDQSGLAKAYPVSILNWHEIVNDRINGESMIVTY